MAFWNRFFHALKAEDVNNVFNQILQSISSNDKIFRSLELILSNKYRKVNTNRVEELKALKSDLAVYQKRLEKAQDLMLDGHLSITDFQPMKSKLNYEIKCLTAKIDAVEDIKNDDEDSVLEFGFYFMSNLDKLFAAADSELKRQIIGSAFPEKLIFENNTYRTASSDNILLLLTNTGKGLRQKKKSIQNFLN
ncbi:MAG TPA: hypothetical protein VL098_10155 [Flavipsychrobacter sp.]|nr:hypothetical protein [Flavipsychrobacter sp.]